MARVQRSPRLRVGLQVIRGIFAGTAPKCIVPVCPEKSVERTPPSASTSPVPWWNVIFGARVSLVASRTAACPVSTAVCAALANAPCSASPVRSPSFKCTFPCRFICVHPPVGSRATLPFAALAVCVGRPFNSRSVCTAPVAINSRAFALSPNSIASLSAESFEYAPAESVPFRRAVFERLCMLQFTRFPFGPFLKRQLQSVRPQVSRIPGSRVLRLHKNISAQGHQFWLVNSRPHLHIPVRAAKALTVSLVAETDGRVIGHIAFSPVTISDGTPNWYGLGPVSVLLEHQRKGIGKALIKRWVVTSERYERSRMLSRGTPGLLQEIRVQEHVWTCA